MARPLPKLGRVQHRIMRSLWERGSATAREITEDLNRERPISHSAVQTLIRELEAKGAVTHDPADRAFVFRPLVREEDVRRSLARDLVDRAFDGSVYGLVAHLLESERIPPEELIRLRELIEKETDR